MKKAIMVCAVALSVTTVSFAYLALQKIKITVPEYRQPGEIIRVDQGWTEAQRRRFHHTAQGTRLIPYAWFQALEQPCLSLFTCPAFTEKSYLGRFGFLPSASDPEWNPDALPVGFALQRDFYDPVSKQKYPVVGLTCAACHTGALHYGKYTVEVEGAPAMIEVTQFQKALGISMFLTQVVPFRYRRFETKVLGVNATNEQKRALKQSFSAFMEAAKAEKTATEEQKVYAIEAGFSRTDALTRIGNQVFAVDMKKDSNFVKSSAPVRFPQLWDASWLDWVQYNSSISDPMIRNIGEALGVRAVAKLYGNDAAVYENSVNIKNLKELEDLLAGPEPFQGLRSPKWPDVFPSLNQERVVAGAKLYQKHCQACHLPSSQELVADLQSSAPVYWRSNNQNRRFLKVSDIDLEYIGTDPHEAQDFINRTADSGDLNKGRVSAAVGLDLVTNGIANSFFQRANFSLGQQAEWRGYRNPAEKAVRAKSVYKARPLNGIWAVAPYLHNGSIPNLYELLSPQKERSTKFWLGSKQFDPVKVGFDPTALKGGYLFDVTSTGNSNAGHAFQNSPLGKGVIGPLLSPEERWALIEYLKSLQEPEHPAGAKAI